MQNTQKDGTPFVKINLVKKQKGVKIKMKMHFFFWKNYFQFYALTIKREAKYK
jgi:hypothetical protein